MSKRHLVHTDNIFIFNVYAILFNPWSLYKMVAQNTVRTYGINQVFRFVEGIWLRRKSCQIRNFTSYVRNKILATMLYKYHDLKLF